MRYIFIELPSFTKEEEDCETDFERWIYVLKNMETLQRLPFQARNSVFKKLASGFAKGEAKGEAKERLKNARSMKAVGIAPDLIAQITGLSLEAIEGL